jgi:hypothetical protein
MLYQFGRIINGECSLRVLLGKPAPPWANVYYSEASFESLACKNANSESLQHLEAAHEHALSVRDVVMGGLQVTRRPRSGDEG